MGASKIIIISLLILLVFCMWVIADLMDTQAKAFEAGLHKGTERGFDAAVIRMEYAIVNHKKIKIDDKVYRCVWSEVQEDEKE